MGVGDDAGVVEMVGRVGVGEHAVCDDHVSCLGDCFGVDLRVLAVLVDVAKGWIEALGVVVEALNQGFR